MKTRLLILLFYLTPFTCIASNSEPELRRVLDYKTYKTICVVEAKHVEWDILTKYNANLSKRHR
ncbi:MAG: hypothetical protein AB7F59_13385 [Bdellovibrionales bacterium]